MIAFLIGFAIGYFIIAPLLGAYLERPINRLIDRIETLFHRKK